MTNNTTIDGIDYGPLAKLVGKWTGDKGLDISPEPDGIEENPYFETILIEAVGDVDNAEKQNLTALRYHQVVSRHSTGKIFHNETGYWIWDSKSEIIMKTLTIPRGVCLVAGGSVNDSGSIVVESKLGDVDFSIVEQPFMRNHASTKSYIHEVKIEADEMTYSQTMVLDIYGRSFDHTDKNTLKRS